MSFVSYLHKVVNRENLSSAEAQVVMELILSGTATTAQISGFLVALRMKGETPDELVGFARAARLKSVKVKTGITNEPVLDTCGRAVTAHARSISQRWRLSSWRAQA